MDEREARAAEVEHQPALYAKAPEPAKRRRESRVTESTYVLQRLTNESWHDVLTVTVPARSHRSSVLLEELKNIQDVTAADRYRLLDERSATVMGLKEKERKDPQFEVVIDP